MSASGIGEGSKRGAGDAPREPARLAIISGAAAGIGRATLQLFLSRGWRCLALDHDAAALQHLEAEGDPQLEVVAADLVAAPEAAASRLSALAGAYEQVTLVNNVGGSRGGAVPVCDLAWEQAADTLAFNLKPMMRLTQLAYPLLREASGARIVNVASAAGRCGVLDVAPDYAAAKGALIAWSRQLVRELATSNILINTICPGIIATERIAQRWQNRAAAANDAALAKIPLKRLGTPMEIAEAIYFLGSAANTYMTGAVLDINGGLFTP